MRKTFAVLAAAAVLLAAACTKPKTKADFVPRARHVQICVDNGPAKTRVKDTYCETAQPDVFWVWVLNREPWPLELPAVGEAIENGRWTRTKPTEAVETIPDTGARFDPARR